MLPVQMSPWQLASVKDGPTNLPLKFGQNGVSNSWDIPHMDKCRKDKCCLTNVKMTVGICSRCLSNLSLKFGQNRANNSWDIADIEFVWWVVVVVDGGVQSHFRLKPKLRLG